MRFNPNIIRSGVCIRQENEADKPQIIMENSRDINIIIEALTKDHLNDIENERIIYYDLTSLSHTK